ncbi:MAG: glycoside hydrolase family 97 protein [Acidimicrobiia bacterium]|nr:glycoside hydrolase family 97 protein [Acidimicrobiia bacterium]
MIDDLMEVRGPSDRLAFELRVAGGDPVFAVKFDDVIVIRNGRLGLVFADQDLSALTLEMASDTEVLEDGYQLVGSEKRIDVAARQRSFEFEAAGGYRLTLYVRVTDDAIGLRYRWDGADDRLLADLTSFRFASPGRAWIQPHDPPALGAPAYEALYADGVPIGTPTDAPSWNLPALFESDGIWLLLAESAVGPGNFGSHLQTDGERTYRIELPYPEEGLSSDPAGEPVSSPWMSPWRLIVVSDDLAGIHGSTAVTDFADASRVANTDWIRPGRVSWSWWSDHTSPTNPGALKESIDLAGDLGWEHTLIDANWNLNDPQAFDDVLAHARARGVGVFLWYNSGGSNNLVPEQPRDRMHEPAVRRSEFARLAEMGIAGVKVDFFHSDRTDIIGRYHAIASDAADAGLMVNFHGCTAPKGWERTWPNVMTMEAVRGAEQYFFAEDYPETAVWHNTVLPFTRNVAGSMDYTPVTFSNQRYPRRTTAGHELALAVVFQSRLQHFADSAASYRAQSPEVWRYLSDVPAVWDESKLVDGYPGEWVVLARRSGVRWWMAGLSGPFDRGFAIDLTRFPGLEAGQVISGEELTVTVAQPVLELTLGPGDGFSLWTP